MAAGYTTGAYAIWTLTCVLRIAIVHTVRLGAATLQIPAVAPIVHEESNSSQHHTSSRKIIRPLSNCDDPIPQIGPAENYAKGKKVSYQLKADGKVSLCKTRRHRRHKKGQSDDLSGENDIEKGTAENPVGASPTGEPASLPPAGAGCRVVASFMSNTSNLYYVRRTLTNDNSGCQSKRNSQLFSRLNELATYPPSLLAQDSLGTDRSRSARKWRHVACKIYQEFVKCTAAKNQMSRADLAETRTPMMTSGVTDTRTVQVQAASSTEATPGDQPEAVHVADTSKVDYMPFMIGDSKYWKDEYEMWFY